MSDETIIVIDIETTGLEVAEHALWEIGAVALIKNDGLWDIGQSWSWQVRLTQEQIEAATPEALEVNQFHKRYRSIEAYDVQSSAAMVNGLTRNRTVACNVPTFDIPFLAAHLRAGRFPVEWHHRVIDIRSVALGVLSPDRDLNYKGSLAALADRIADSQKSETAHTAAGDAAWSAGLLADMLSGSVVAEVQIPVAWEGTD